jgi:hypothetical protein
MKRRVTDLAKKAPFYYRVRSFMDKKRHAREHREWVASGRPVPPPHLAKQDVLRAIAKEFGYRVLVETGTYYGEMIEALRNEFERLYTVELSAYLFNLAARRFRNSTKIHVIQGNSADKLPEILAQIHQPALFWLDGHYSSGITACGHQDTPVLLELQAILSAEDLGHAIVIDDARDFGSDPAYPSFADVQSLILSKWPDREIRISNDSIQITPRSREQRAPHGEQYIPSCL